jgi:hypothetical protein
VSSYPISLANTSYSEVTMNKGVKGVIILHPLNKYCIQWCHYEKRYERCHTFYHCDLTDRSIYWGDEVQWHLSHLLSLWPHCMKYVLRGWSTMTSFTLFVIHPLNKYFIQWGHYEKGMKGVIVLHPFNKYFIQWGHNEKRYERCHRTPCFQ